MDHELGGTGLELIEERPKAALKIVSAEQAESPEVVGTAQTLIVGAPVCRKAPRGAERGRRECATKSHAAARRRLLRDPDRTGFGCQGHGLQVRN
jgi:hypothetical protein